MPARAVRGHACIRSTMCTVHAGKKVCASIIRVAHVGRAFPANNVRREPGRASRSSSAHVAEAAGLEGPGSPRAAKGCAPMCACRRPGCGVWCLVAWCARVCALRANSQFWCSARMRMRKVYLVCVALRIRIALGRHGETIMMRRATSRAVFVLAARY